MWRVGWGCLLCGPVPCPGGDEGGVGVSPVWTGPLSWWGWGWGGGVSCVDRCPVLVGMRVGWGCLLCGPVPCPGGVEGGVGVSPVWTGPLSWWGGGWGGGVSCVDRSPVLVGWRVGWGCLLCGPVPCPGGVEGGVGVSPVWTGPLSWRGWGWGGGVSYVGRSPVLVGWRVWWGVSRVDRPPVMVGLRVGWGGVGWGGVGWGGVSPVWTGPLFWWVWGWGGVGWGGVSPVWTGPCSCGSEGGVSLIIWGMASVLQSWISRPLW